MLAHGGGYYPGLTLIPRKPGVFNRYQRVSLFAGILMDQGYVVVWTRRGATTGSSQNRPVETVRLDDERVVGGKGKPGKSFTDHVGWIRDITEITRAFLEEQLGSKPEYTFAIGHSAGGSLLRSVNLVPGMNQCDLDLFTIDIPVIFEHMAGQIIEFPRHFHPTEATANHYE